MKRTLVQALTVASFLLVFSYVSLASHGNIVYAQQTARDVKNDSTPWYDGCFTKEYGWGEGSEQEHGNDISCFAYGTPITALLSGRVSYAGWTPFGGFCEVTWKLDNPGAASGSPYAYAEDMSSCAAWTGEYLHAGQIIGYSELWVEFGLTPDWAYGISNWRWGPNSMNILLEARSGHVYSGTPVWSKPIHPSTKKTVCNKNLWNISGRTRNTGIEHQWCLEQLAGHNLGKPLSSERKYWSYGIQFVKQWFADNVYYLHRPDCNCGSFFKVGYGLLYPGL